jgi:hypothetical protein
MEVKMDKLYFWILMIVFLKSFTIGSEFNFSAWIRHGKKYWRWYNDRETWRQYLDKDAS